MTKKETILKAAVCYWSEADECFVTESPLLDVTAGVGETPQDSRNHFAKMIGIAYEDLKANKIAGYNRVGRPAKEGIALNCKVRSETHVLVKKLAEELEISQGEAIDVIAFFYSVRSTETPLVPHAIEILRRLEKIEKRLPKAKRKSPAKPTKTRSSKKKRT